MIPAYRAALGPLLLLQGRRVRRLALRLPEADGPREGREPGAGEPLRLLVVGDSSAAGVGVGHQREAVAWPAARALAARTGRPVAWQLVAKSGVHTGDALDLVRAAPLGAFDVAVFALGVNDVTAQRLGPRFIADYQALVDHVQARTGARHIVANGLPPMHLLPQVPQPLRWYLGQCARRNDAHLAAWCAARTGHAHLSLAWADDPDNLAHDGYHPGAVQYARWAEAIADRAAQLLAG